MHRRHRIAIIILILSFVFTHNIDAQYYTPSTRFKPFTYEELLLQAQAQAYREQKEAEDRARRSAQFDKYQNSAYECINRRDYHGFLKYSSYALNTGFYNAKLYYDRGFAYSQIGYYKEARKEYRKAKRYGYYLANQGLADLRQKQKRLKKSAKSNK